MIRFVVRVLGVPVLSIDASRYDYETVSDDEVDEDGGGAGGGSAHNFERDTSPLSPTAHHEWQWDERKHFGFGAPCRRPAQQEE
jgi:hypothetical protein